MDENGRWVEAAAYDRLVDDYDSLRARLAEAEREWHQTQDDYNALLRHCDKLEQRAEKAERERDELKRRIRTMCKWCKREADECGDCPLYSAPRTTPKGADDE
jgi:chromosome segregation ATPase